MAKKDALKKYVELKAEFPDHQFVTECEWECPRCKNECGYSGIKLLKEGEERHTDQFGKVAGVIVCIQCDWRNATAFDLDYVAEFPREYLK